MNNFFNKRVVVSFLFVLLAIGVIGQTKTEYFMRTSYMRTYLNPALTPDQGQLIIPVLPNIGANIQTNTINLDHLTFKKNGERVTFLHPSVSSNEFLGDMKKDNYIRADVNYKIFALGLFIGKHYTNFDIGVRTQADINLPKSTFELLKVGFDQDMPTTYNLSNLSATASSFVEIGASQSRNFLNNSLAVGARVKLLLGAGYIDLNAESLEIEAGPEKWRSLSKVTLRGAAPGVKPTYKEDEIDESGMLKEGMLDGFDFGWKGIPGYGAGIDVGAVYDLSQVLPVLSGLKVSAALNDIGFIYWTKKNAVELMSPETAVEVTPNQYTHGNDGDNSLSNVLEDAFNDLKQAVNLRSNPSGSKARSTSLRMNMNLGAEYELLKDKLSVGALYSARFGNYYTSHEFTVSGNYQPFSWLGTSLSYSAVHSAFDTFGFAMHLAPKKGMTFFVASDYVLPHVSTQFVPTSSKELNLQVGFSVPIGKTAKARAKQDLDIE